MNDSTRSANAKTQRRTPGGQWMKESVPFNAVQNQLSVNDHKAIENINAGFTSGKYDDQIIETLNMNGKDISRKDWETNATLRTAARGYFSQRYAEVYR